MLDFTLKDPPAGTDPSITLELGTTVSFTLTAAGLGDPGGLARPQGSSAGPGPPPTWLSPTPRDDKPELGTLLARSGPDYSCTAAAIAHPAEQYTRLSVLASSLDVQTPPTLAEGYDRLATTRLAPHPPLVPAT